MSKRELPTIERPEVQRTLVTAIDRQTGKSKSITVYRCEPEAVIGLLEKAIAVLPTTEKEKTSAAA